MKECITNKGGIMQEQKIKVCGNCGSTNILKSKNMCLNCDEKNNITEVTREERQEQQKDYNYSAGPLNSGGSII